MMYHMDDSGEFIVSISKEESILSQKILSEKFPSIDFTLHEYFKFSDKADEAYFMLFFNEGISI